jgi:zinc/manganese transport system permease protein
MAFSLASGHEIDTAETFWYSVGFALGGAFLISLTRFRRGKVPHEAIIGIVYVLSTAAAIVVLEFAPTGHGLEELKSMLAGNILFVESGQIRSTAIMYGLILAVAIALWRPITAVTFKPEADGANPKSILLDIVFYALLGLVVAYSVKIAGVLVVFSWLVMPAVIAFFFVDGMLPAVIIAVATGLVGSFAGLVVSFFAPALHFTHTHEEPNPIEAAGQGGWPTGPSIVVALGAMVILAHLIRIALPARYRELDETDSR